MHRPTAPLAEASSPAWRRALTKTTWLRPPAVLTYASLLLLCSITPAAKAQPQSAEPETSRNSLPDAPQPQSGQQSTAEQTLSEEGSASVSGVVLDASGAAVPDAQVSLTHRDGTQLRTLTSGATVNLPLPGFPPVPISSSSTSRVLLPSHLQSLSSPRNSPTRFLRSH
jgi:hypothetical protein